MRIFIHLLKKDYHNLFETLISLYWWQPTLLEHRIFLWHLRSFFRLYQVIGLYFNYTRDRNGYTKSNATRLLKLYTNLWIFLFPIGVGHILQKEFFPDNYKRILSNLLALTGSPTMKPGGSLLSMYYLSAPLLFGFNWLKSGNGKPYYQWCLSRISQDLHLGPIL